MLKRVDKCKQCGHDIPLTMSRRLIFESKADCLQCHTPQEYQVNIIANFIYWFLMIGGTCIAYYFLSKSGDVDYILPISFFVTLLIGVWISVKTLKQK